MEQKKKMFLNKPKKVIIEDVEYPINTHFKYALKCDEIATDENIGEYERALAIIYTLFGEKGLESEHHEQLLEYAVKFLKGTGEPSDDESDMDYKQDWGHIKASFMSDYGLMIDNEDMHYYDFIDLLGGLTEHSALSRVRYIRGYDTKDLKGKELADMNKLKKQVELKKPKKKLTEEQEKSVERLMELIGG